MLMCRNSNNLAAVASCVAISLRVPIHQSYENRLGGLQDAASLRCNGDFHSQRNSIPYLDILILGSLVADSEGSWRGRSQPITCFGGVLPYRIP